MGVSRWVGAHEKLMVILILIQERGSDSKVKVGCRFIVLLIPCSTSQIADFFNKVLRIQRPCHSSGVEYVLLFPIILLHPCHILFDISCTTIALFFWWLGGVGIVCGSGLWNTVRG